MTQLSMGSDIFILVKTAAWVSTNVDGLAMLHTKAAWCSLLVTGHKILQHATLLNIAINCNTMNGKYSFLNIEKMEQNQNMGDLINGMSVNHTKSEAFGTRNCPGWVSDKGMEGIKYYSALL